MILVDEHGDEHDWRVDGANDELSVDMVERALMARERIHAVVANLGVPIDAVVAAARICRDQGRAFILNPAPATPTDAEILRSSAVVTPNEHEIGGLGFGSPFELLSAGATAVVPTFRRGAALNDSIAVQGWRAEWGGS